MAQFCTEVDRFLGDTVREEFNKINLSGVNNVYNGPMPMDLSFVGPPANDNVKRINVVSKSPFTSINPGGKGANTPANKNSKGNPNSNNNWNSSKSTSKQSSNKGGGKSKGKGKGNWNNSPSSSNYSNSNGKNNNNAENTQKPNPNQQNKGKGKSAAKKKPNPPRCGWCGQGHFSNSCTDKSNPKWSSYVCKLCSGKAHPEQVCPLNGINKQKN